MILKLKSLFNKPEQIQVNLYRYFTLEASLNVVLANMHYTNLNTLSSLLEIIPLDTSDGHITSNFRELYIHIALTSTDPLENFSDDEFSHTFGNSYLLYYMDKLVGYCTITYEEQGQIVCVASIGIHHRYRQKGFVKHLLIQVLNQLIHENIEKIQADIHSKNMASLGLFEKFGFQKIDEFNL